MIQWSVLAFFAFGFLSVGCHQKPAPNTLALAKPHPLMLKAKLKSRILMEHPDAIGVSGSCQNKEGQWFIAERNQKLLQLKSNGSLMSHAITGVPQDLDLEGLACTDNHFYISTEQDIEARSSDLILKVEFQGQELRVTKTIPMHYPKGMLAGDNQGLEGLCIAGDWLIAAGEVLRTTADGHRQAPILRQRLGSQETFLHWVELSSDTGKLSGIDCRKSGDAIEVFAIERHFSVGRIVHYILGEVPAPVQTLVDFAHILRQYDNFESLLVGKDGSLSLSNDNQYKVITGPTEVTEFEPIPAFAY